MAALGGQRMVFVPPRSLKTGRERIQPSISAPRTVDCTRSTQRAAKRFGSIRPGGGISASPTVSEGAVYFGSDDSRVYAVSAETGELIWRYGADHAVGYAPSGAANGAVYIGLHNGLYALDAADGELRWRFDGSFGHSTPAAANGVVYIGSSDNHLYALDAETGELKWRYKTHDAVHLSAAVSNGVVYAGSGDNHLYALDAESGELKWRYKTRLYVHSTPAVSNGVVYIGSDDYHLYALDAASGELKWRFRASGHIRDSLAVSDGAVYFVSWDGFRVRPERGERRTVVEVQDGRRDTLRACCLEWRGVR